MQTSNNGFNLIKKWEGIRLKAYKCTADVSTIGFGTTRYPNGKPVKMGDTCSQVQAEDYLHNDAKVFETVINKNAKVPLSQNQFDALMCFIYNVGAGAFTNSTMLKHLNTGNYKQAADDLLAWNKVHGKVDKGLVNRRNDERKLFLQA